MKRMEVTNMSHVEGAAAARAVQELTDQHLPGHLRVGDQCSRLELPSHRDMSSPQEGPQKGNSRSTAKYSRSISPPQSVPEQVTVFQGELHCLPQESAVSERITWTRDSWGTKGEKSLPELIAEDHKYQDWGK